MEHYLDNAATTAVLPCAMEAAVRAMEEFGNPGSLHAKGAAARRILDDSRKTVAAALVTRLGADVCRDGGSQALAGAVEMAGAAASLAVAMPLLQAVTELSTK